MLIEVKQDILDKAISKDASLNSEAIAFLCELSLAVKRGKHIVFVPSLNGNPDLVSALKEIVGNNIVAFFYPMSHVSEIENLIPKVIYQENSTNAKQKTVLDHDYSFYDMKKGLCYNRLWFTPQYDYWKEVYRDDVDFTQLDSIRSQHKSYDTFKGAVNDKKLLPGWSNDILKKIMDNPILVGKLRKIKQSDLSASQNFEWTRIGELMYNWTCSLKPRRA